MAQDRLTTSVPIKSTFPGRPEVNAEGIATMEGFREGVDGDWLITGAEHYVGPNGYRCTIECEQPNSADGATKATQASADDQVQGATVVE